MTQHLDSLPTETAPQDEFHSQSSPRPDDPSLSHHPLEKAFAGWRKMPAYSSRGTYAQIAVHGTAGWVGLSEHLEDRAHSFMFMQAGAPTYDPASQMSDQWEWPAHVGEEDPVTSEKRRALIAAVEAAVGHPNVEQAAITIMKAVVQALPVIALEPEVVVGEDDGTIEFDWESEAGRGCFYGRRPSDRTCHI